MGNPIAEFMYSCHQGCSGWSTGRADVKVVESSALIKQAINAARMRDAASGYAFQIAVITKDGFKAVEGPLVK